MRALVAALALFAVSAACPMTLVLPHELREDEIASLEVTVGVIQRGAEIQITTPAGRLLGVVSPYGIRPGEEAGTYTIPVPPDAISGKRLRVLVSLTANGKERAPSKKEVKKVRVMVTRRSGE